MNPHGHVAGEPLNIYGVRYQYEDYLAKFGWLISLGTSESERSD